MVKRNINNFNLKKDVPSLCREWNYNRNDFNPENFYKSSYTKVWWICNRGHEWKASIHARVFMKNNCPYCSNKKVCEDNCLATLNPTLTKEWNYDKNDISPYEIMPGSNKKVWWRCEKCGYEWKAWIRDRVKGTKCTKCNYGYVLRDKSDIYTLDGRKYCRVCNEPFDLSEFRVKGNNSKGYWESNTCKKCESDLVRDYRLTDKGIAAEIVRRTKHISKKKSIPFDLDKSWVLDRLNKINWRCELTGIPMVKKRDNLQHTNTGFQWNSISIDKIVPEKGYVKSNVRFVLNQINCFKQDGDDDRLYMLAERLLEFKNKKENI